MRLFVLLLVSSLFAAKISYAQFENVEIKTQQVAEHIYMLAGEGGNIGVLTDGQRMLMIDDQFEPLAEKIKTALQTIQANSHIDYIVNTHFHGDHTGGNAVFGQEATIMAHHNVRHRLLKKFDKTSPALPVLTYEKHIAIHFGQETIELHHVPKSHTDGDTFVIFKQANVIHAGDLFFSGLFPFIDVEGGGSVSGYIESIRKLMKISNKETKIIPGHGPLSTKKELTAYLEMLVSTRKEVLAYIKKGYTVDKIIERGLSKKWASWHWSFITEEKWIKTLYNDFS